MNVCSNCHYFLNKSLFFLFTLHLYLNLNQNIDNILHYYLFSLLHISNCLVHNFVITVIESEIVLVFNLPINYIILTQEKFFGLSKRKIILLALVKIKLDFAIFFVTGTNFYNFL